MTAPASAASAEIDARSKTHSHPRRLAYLDGWRGLSILAVLAGHFIGESVFTLGSLGVEMFFVLSGRLMVEILFLERFPLKEFYRRRVSRIFPALIVFLILSVAMFHDDAQLRGKPTAAASVVFLAYNYLAAFGHRVGVFDHTWSLCVEEHSYIALALLALFARRRNINVRLVLITGAVASLTDGVFCNVLLHQDLYSGYWRTDTHIASILLAGYFFLTISKLRRVPAWITPVCALLGAVSFSNALPLWVHFTAGSSFLAVAVATLDASWAPLKRFLSLRILTLIGVLSYSIYLWQQPFYQLAIWKWHLPPMQAAAWSMPALACGIASFFLVERPARRFLNALKVSAWGRS